MPCGATVTISLRFTCEIYLLSNQNITTRNVMYPICTPSKNKKYNYVIFFIFGRGNKIRTCDLYVPNVALYQTELCPEIVLILQQQSQFVKVFIFLRVSKPTMRLSRQIQKNYLTQHQHRVFALYLEPS